MHKRTPSITQKQGFPQGNWGCVLLFDLLAAPPYNGLITWTEVDHLLQKKLQQSYILILYKFCESEEFVHNDITGFTTAIYISLLINPQR